MSNVVKIQREQFTLQPEEVAESMAWAKRPLVAFRIDSAMFDGKPINVTAQIILRGSAEMVNNIVAAIEALASGTEEAG